MTYHAQVIRHDIIYDTVKKPSTVLFTLSKPTWGRLSTYFSTKRGGFTRTEFVNISNPDNGKSMSSYVPNFHLKGSDSAFHNGGKLVAAARAMNEAVFCSNLIEEFGFGNALRKYFAVY